MQSNHEPVKEGWFTLVNAKDLDGIDDLAIYEVTCVDLTHNCLIGKNTRPKGSPIPQLVPVYKFDEEFVQNFVFDSPLEAKNKILQILSDRITRLTQKVQGLNE